MRRALLAAAAICLLAPAAAVARKPVVAYVDANDRLRLYDAERGRAATAPDITIPGPVRRWGISHDGRYIVFADADRKLHLHDRALGRGLPLPGIDIYAAPGNPTVSNGGLIAFDDNSNGPTRVYDGLEKTFVNTGLNDANNGHRQPRLSGNGRFLATTCLNNCARDTGGDSDAFLQDLRTRADVPFPDDVSGAGNRDEEHPCIDGDGSRLGVDAPNPNQRDVFLFDRAGGRTVATPGLDDPNQDDRDCALDASGAYLGTFTNAGGFRVWAVAARAFIALPGLTDSKPAWLTDPWPPPDRRRPVISRVFARPATFEPAGAGGRGTILRFRLSEAATVRVLVSGAAQGSASRLLRTYRLRGRRGANRLRLTGRVKVGRRFRALRPGRYRLGVTATDRAGNRARSRAIRVRVQG